MGPSCFLFIYTDTLNLQALSVPFLPLCVPLSTTLLNFSTVCFLFHPTIIIPLNGSCAARSASPALVTRITYTQRALLSIRCHGFIHQLDYWQGIFLDLRGNHEFWMLVHMDTCTSREEWFPSKSVFFLPATDMQSVRQRSFQLNSNSRAICWFNFTSVPRGTRETCHSCLTHPKSRRTLTASNPWPVLKHVDPACNVRHWVKSRWRGLLGLEFGVFCLLGFDTQKPFGADAQVLHLSTKLYKPFPSLISAGMSGTSLYTKKGKISSVPNIRKIW